MEIVADKFKQTELGLIPKDWDVDLLEKYWTVTDCKHITAKFIPNGFPLASITEVQSLYVNLATAMQTTPEYYSKLIEGNRKPLIGDLIFSRNATVGEVAQVAEWHPPFAMGQDVCLLRKRKASYSTVYLQTLVKSPIIRKQLNDLMVGSTFKRVNIEQIRNFSIPFPSNTEQTAIATALSDTDGLIRSLENFIVKKRNIKQGVMQKLLASKEGWEVKKLGEVFTISASNSKSSYLTDGGKYIVMDMGSVSSDGSILKSKRTNHNSDILNFGDLVMPKDDIGGGNIIGKVGFIDQKNTYVLGDHVYKLEVITLNVYSLYFYFLINSVFINKHFRAKASGSAQLGLGRKSVLEQELNFPKSKEEQIRIATILSDMNAEIAALEIKLDKYKKVKLGMMQNLLTGKIRLVNHNG